MKIILINQRVFNEKFCIKWKRIMHIYFPFHFYIGGLKKVPRLYVLWFKVGVIQSGSIVQRYGNVPI